MNKIQRTSRCLRWLFTALMIIAPSITLASWFVFTPEPNSANSSVMMGFSELRNHFPTMEQPLPLEFKLIGLLISLIPLSINLCIYYNFITLFLLYEQREFFNMQNVAAIRKIGIYLLLGQLLSPFIEAATTALLTWHNTPGKRMASITFDNSNVGMIITGVLIILISWIIAEGHRLNEEQRLTI
ncbi:MAG: DUF2975 domain-containing protein [Pseudomonadota bacterium]|nr:DUF2975 domain-containing protein [Pseudomonadota bacterium]